MRTESTSRGLPQRDEGQTMAEYAVTLAVISAGAVAVYAALSGGIAAAIARVIRLIPA